MNGMMIRSVDWIVVHCAATRADMDIGLKEIRQLHMQKGWSDVGYHYIIRRDGSIEKGRTDTTPGAHAKGYNMYSLSVCLVGGCNMSGPVATPTADKWYSDYVFQARAENNFTKAQFISLQKILTDLQAAHPNAEILGHRDLPGVNKGCPSFDVRGWLHDEEHKRADDTRTEDTPDQTTVPREEPRKTSRRRSCRRKSSRL